jgi:hypothetical protein
MEWSGNQSLYLHLSFCWYSGWGYSSCVNHKKPTLLDVLVGDKIINLDLEHIMDIIGWVPEFNPIYCGSGFREYPRWYPKYCYTYDI